MQYPPEIASHSGLFFPKLALLRLVILCEALGAHFSQHTKEQGSILFQNSVISMNTRLLAQVKTTTAAAFLLGLFPTLGTAWDAQAQAVEYDIVYVRSPRAGDDQRIEFPEVKDPIRAAEGSDLVLLRPDGSETVLVPGGHGAIIDPYPSFDGEWIYYSKFYDQRPEARDRQRAGHPSRAGADIFKLHVPSGEIVQLTFQEWTPNTGIIDWSEDHLRADENGDYYLGYGVFNLGPCPLPDGRLVFTSSRNNYLPNQDFTAPNQQLFVMDDDGKNVELIGHLNLGSALHPTVLTDGRIMFSSYEAQGLRDRRIWGLWSIWPDGRQWEPLMSAFTSPSAFHFQTQLGNGDLSVVEYYNQNNNGFGTLLAFDSNPLDTLPAFGSPNASDDTNPPIQRGIWWFNDSHPSHKKPRYTRYSFSPQGLYSLTPFSHGEDNASSRDLDGGWAGKVTHPSGAPHNDVLVTWTPGPANDLNRPTNRPVYDAGIYVIAGGEPADDHRDLVLIKNDPNYNEMQPRALVTYESIYGITEPQSLPENQNDGSAHPSLAPGTPFGLVGASSFYRRDSFPSRGRSEFDGLDPFNTSQNNVSSNWSWQGADAGKYENSDIYAVRILAMEPSSHVARGPGIGNGRYRGFYNFAQERLRILGEIPLRKTDATGNTVTDPEGNPDTSFLAKIPADTPFTFQTLDRDGLVLNMSQTWHQVRPGEMRANCGGCHAHSQMPLDFSLTAAAQPEYSILDLAKTTPVLSKSETGEVITKNLGTAPLDVEYYRDIKPILQRSCIGCHSLNGPAEADLVLDDESVVDGLENTYNRLARDSRAEYGIPPVIRNQSWRQHNASRYIRKFQSRRSLLTWKLFGRRMDGWSNEDHPTESVTGDASTLPAGADPNHADIDYTGTIMPPPGSGYPPLSEDEKIMFARWIDLGAPISYQEGVRALLGWFADDLRPTLDLSLPRRGHHESPITTIRLGAFDYYSGLDQSTLSVKSNLPLNGRPANAELIDLFTETDEFVWSLELEAPIVNANSGEIRVQVRDTTGNLTEVVRHFSVDAEPLAPPAPLPPTQVQAKAIENGQVQVTWEAPHPAPEFYALYRQGEPIGETNTLRFVDEAPPIGVPLIYSVSSVSSQGEQSDATQSGEVVIPAPPSGPILNDPFSPEHISSWKIIDSGSFGGPSDWEVIDGVMVQSSNIYSFGFNLDRQGSMAIWAQTEAFSWDDYLLTAELSTFDDDGLGIQFRYQDENNFYRLDLDHLQAFSRLIRVVDGRASLLAGTFGGPPLGEIFEVAVEVIGNQISVLLDGKNAFPGPVFDDALSHGTVGLYSFANQAAQFHNLVVQAPSSKAPLLTDSVIDRTSLPSEDLTPPEARPELHFERRGERLRLRWQDPLSLWSLESTHSATNPHWTNVPTQKGPTHEERHAEVTPDRKQAFYRLARLPKAR